MQSRYQSVKCPVNRELSSGRRVVTRGFGVASRCYITEYLYTSDVVKETAKEVFFMKKLKDVRVLTSAALVLAIAIALGFFKIPITQLIEIRFDTLALATAGQMFGPAVGLMIGALSDLGGFLIRPTGPFFPGFTISAAITGLIFGFMLYGKKVSLLRVVLAKLIHTLLVGMLLNSFWLSMLYGNAFPLVFLGRLPKELIMFPIQTAMIYVLLKAFEKAKVGKLAGLATE